MVTEYFAPNIKPNEIHFQIDLARSAYFRGWMFEWTKPTNNTQTRIASGTYG